VTPERWRKIEEAYHAALAVPESERVIFLKSACADDESLISEVQALLAQPTGGASFLEAPAVEVAAQSLAMSAGAGAGAESSSSPGATRLPERARPETIGRYRVIRLLGEGGMGTVYEAEQEQPRRVVALKIIKPGYATAETLRRFQHESQALGRLQHPGIAQIYEASTADTGFGPQPYFAMEMIRGQALREFAETRHLDVRERLRLMAKVCDAVDHAHHRGVIHRDLKPGNILVDETGQPKILDFGVAHVTESDVQLTRTTDVGQLVGTLAYMSPEQVSGDPQVLDTRSDVYSLGVILYELLAGRPPYHIGKKPVHEAIQTIREEEPEHLSSIQRSYRGDVETIVAKALEKDKARRYASAAELAADTRRYLADEPILARPASASYQLQKFARRHKALVIGAMAVVLALAAGAIASTVELVRARAEKRRADAEAATAQAVNDFLRDDLLAQASSERQGGPGTKLDPDLKVRTALDRAAARIPGKFAHQPEVEAAIRDTIGQTYSELGLYPEASRHLELALELERRVLGTENPKTLRTMSQLGMALFFQGKYPQAEALFSRTVSSQRRVLGLEHPDTLRSVYALAADYEKEGKIEQAAALFSRNLEIERRVLGPEHLETLRSMNGLAVTFNDQGKYAQSEVLYNQLLQSQRRVLGAEHPDTLMTMNNLSTDYDSEGKYTLAAALQSQALEIQRRVLGATHPDTLISMNNLADDYREGGKYVQAEALFSQTIEIQRRILGPEHPYTLIARGGLAQVYSAQGRYARAEELFGRVLKIERRVLAAEHPVTLAQLWAMAAMYQGWGKYALAERHAAQALAGRRHVLGSQDPDTMASAADLSLAYQSQGKFAESEPLAREAMQYFRGKFPDGWQGFRAESLLGASLAGQKKFADAEPLLIEGYRGMLARQDRIAVPDRYHLERARESIVRLYQAWGRLDKAAEWKRK